MNEMLKNEEKRRERGQEIIRQHGLLAKERSNFESHWQEIAQRVVPMHKNSFNSLAQQTKGDKRTEFIFDSTAAQALNRFAAIMDSLLTPRNQTWHRLKASDDKLNKQRDVMLWFEQANKMLFRYRYSPVANFSSQNQMIFKNLGAYGTGGMFIDDLKGGLGLRYKSVALSELFIRENHQGVVDSVYRYFALTARQAYQKWGDKLPEVIREKAKGSGGEDEYFFIHCVRPRTDKDGYNPERKDAKGKPFISEYVSVQGSLLLSEGGYDSFPYAITRYEQDTNEVYGRSPAMDVLPAIKTLNEQKKTLLKQGHRAVDPVLLAHDDGILNSFSMKPGAINAGGVSADGRPLVHALPTGNPLITKELMDDERNLIKDAFFVSLFQILVETPTMSATEVLERTKEKGLLLAPTIGRQQSEYLGPMIERELDIMVRQGILPPMPQALIEAQGEYRIEYDSPLSRAQRAEEASGLMRTLETALQVVNVTQDVTPLDHFDWDTIMPEVAEIQAVPARWMRALDEVQAMRQGRAQQQQQQQAIQAAPAAAAMIKAQAAAKKG